MSDPAALVLGTVVGGLLVCLAFGLAISILLVAVASVRVFIGHERVPIVYNLRSLAGRRLTTFVTVCGLTLVVFVFATVLMLGAGIRRALVSSGEAMNVKILRKGSQAEIESDVLPEQVQRLSTAPEIALGDDGRPLVSAEVVVLVFALHEAATNETDGANITVRGVGRDAFDLHLPEELKGRKFTPGTSEIVIGKALLGRFRGAMIGGTMHFARREWQVVGVVDHGGTAYDSEIWGDVNQMMDGFQRRPASVTVGLKEPSGFLSLTQRMSDDLQLNSLDARLEVDYWESQSRRFVLFVTLLGGAVAVIFSFGAILGAMITMYAQVAARISEIGTLRAIGFKPRAVLVSFVVESVLMGLLSGALALALAAGMRWVPLSATNWQTQSQIAFHLRLSPGIALASLAFAAFIGYTGGLLPALRAAKAPIVRATRGG